MFAFIWYKLIRRLTIYIAILYEMVLCMCIYVCYIVFVYTYVGVYTIEVIGYLY